MPVGKEPEPMWASLVKLASAEVVALEVHVAQRSEALRSAQEEDLEALAKASGDECEAM